MRFRGGLVIKARRLVHDSTLGWKVIKKRESSVVQGSGFDVLEDGGDARGFKILSLGFSVTTRWSPTLS